jgi:RNA polymerase sigma factor (TIGR02999 family)
MGEITKQLNFWAEGDESALNRLFLLVQAELHRRATFRMHRERKNHTLSPTALVNEVYCKLRRGKSFPLRNRDHFFAVATIIMQRILLDHWRKFKRRPQTVQLDTYHSSLPALLSSMFGTDDLLAINVALERLAKEAPREARVVALRVFVGLKNGEIAGILNISENQVMRDWKCAKAWLRRELASGKNDDGSARE